MNPMFWIWDAILFILPAYFANSLPVILGGGPSMDRGRKWKDGRPLLGEGKTIRGALVAIAAAALLGAIYQFFPPSGDLSSQMTLVVGLVMGVGTVLGDTIGSFLKRRLNIQRGETLPLIDQDGFVLMALLLTHFIQPVPLLYWILILAITPFVHVAFNVIAYIVHWKNVPY